MIIREITNKTGEILLSQPRFLHVLIGPRQVGKSTAAKQIAEQTQLPCVIATADSPQPVGPEWIESNWNRALALSTDKQPALLIFDELQKAQGWSEVIKLLWDEIKDSKKVPLRVLLLGSSALLLQAGLTESLAGRFLLHQFPHWSYLEMKRGFGVTLDEYVYFGGYPGAAELRHTEELWRDYIQNSLIETTLSRDILQLQKVAKPALLRSLFFSSVSHPAEIVSYNKLMGELYEAGNASTLINYLQLLASAFLVQGVKKYPSAPSRNTTPKIITLNNALVSACSPRSFSEARKDSRWWGRLVENLMGAHILSSLNSTLYQVSYFRQKVRGKDLEVDFVIHRPNQLWGIEVSTSKVHSLQGLEYFSSRHTGVKPVYIGADRIEEVLSEPAVNLLG